MQIPLMNRIANAIHSLECLAREEEYELQGAAKQKVAKIISELETIQKQIGGRVKS